MSYARDEAFERILDEVRRRDDELTPSQKALLWTLRVWLAVAEPVVAVFALGVALSAMVWLIVYDVPVAVGFAVYFVGAVGGAVSVRYGLRAVKRALFRRVLKSLDIDHAAISGSTPAGMPALDGRSTRR